MKQKIFKDPEVAIVFVDYPKNVREKLMFLRQLIFDTAEKIEEVGELEETLKWGQPSYLTIKQKTGTTIRIDQTRSHPGQYAMYFHCQTNLVEIFRHIYPHEFTYQGNRAIIFNEHDKIPVKKLRHCIELALIYHLGKKANH